MQNEVIIQGGIPLHGTISVSGSKNAAVALIPAALLSRSIVTLRNVPNIQDIRDMEVIVTYLGAVVSHQGNDLTIDATHLHNRPLHLPEVQRVRASYYLMGVLLALFHDVEMTGPGGCRIGSRPIDLHQFAFSKLGFTNVEKDYIHHIYGSPIRGTIVFPKNSVGATINALLAASHHPQVVIIDGAAIEPEVDEVGKLINAMGGSVRGIGTSTLIVGGGSAPFHGTEFTIIPDRIEAGTYALIGAALADQLEIKPIIKSHLSALLQLFSRLGINYEVKGGSLFVYHGSVAKSLHVVTAPYPGFPTDLQQPLTTFLTQVPGVHRIEDTIFTQRTAHVAELIKMGAQIVLEDTTMVIHGGTPLQGATVSGKDLRGGASLLLAGMIAQGESHILGLKHVHRGYNNIISKLQTIGAHMELVGDNDHDSALI